MSNWGYKHPTSGVMGPSLQLVGAQDERENPILNAPSKRSWQGEGGSHQPGYHGIVGIYWVCPNPTNSE